MRNPFVSAHSARRLLARLLAFAVAPLSALALVATTPAPAAAYSPPASNLFPHLQDSHTYNASGNPSDVVNVVVFGPHLNSLDVPHNVWQDDGIISSQTLDVFNNNQRVAFNTARTTDTTVWDVRNHARFWVNANCAGPCVQELYIAASVEYHSMRDSSGKPYDCGSDYHCLIPNNASGTGGRSGFEFGRDGLPDIGLGEPSTGVYQMVGSIQGMVPAITSLAGSKGWAYSTFTYSSGTAGFTHHNSDGTVAVTDGNVTAICIDPYSSGFCSPSPLTLRSAANHDYVSNELGFTGNAYTLLRARSATQGPWESWTLVSLPNSQVALLSNVNSLFVSAEIGWTGNDYAKLRARSPSIGPWETFKMTYNSDGTYSLQSVANSQYVSAELGWTGNDYGTLRARNGTIGPWEKFTTSTNVYNPPSGNHAVWSSDSYNGAPLVSITLNSQQVSNPIYINFLNQGPGNWDSNTVLAYWSGGTDDGQPADGSRWCHAPGSDWYSCNPGVSAWIGYATIQPGQLGQFVFQIQAPQTGSAIDSTLYFRPAHRMADGSYQWIDTAAGNRTYDYFNVHVNAGCARCQ